ncbi:MAG TPA: hypothetical protein VLE95_05385 [Chlamydiales bacterium]|nr:hypothetical protein [Chlamydiales bacterium]
MPFSISETVEDGLHLIQSALLLLKEEQCILASSTDAAFFQKKSFDTIPSSHLPPPKIIDVPKIANHTQTKALQIDTPLYRNNLKNREFDKEAARVFASGASDHCLRQGASEDKKNAAKPTSSKTDSSGCFGIQPSQKSPPKSLANLRMRPFFEKNLPELVLIDPIPDDRIARQIANRWKTKNQAAPISILTSGELPKHKIFLSEIALALDVFCSPAKLIEAEAIEKENGWKLFLSSDHLKLILICDSTLWQLASLRQFYKENPAMGNRVLGSTPVFLLPDLSLYLKDPLLKRSLWNNLCRVVT